MPNVSHLVQRCKGGAARYPRALAASGILCPVLLFGAHYVFGEWVRHPRVELWSQPRFWADLPLCLLCPLLFWLAARIVTWGRIKLGGMVARMAACLAVGDLLFFLWANSLQSLGKRLPGDYWHYWTYWMPGLLLCSALVVVVKAWRPPTLGEGWRRLWRGHPVTQALALALATLALGLSALNLGLPRLSATEITVPLARDFLVADSEQADFDYLAQSGNCWGKPLGAWLDHLHLARLQRQHFYSQLDGVLFQSCVLSPEVGPLPLAEIEWRRDLWEVLYPAVRQTREVREGAGIVLRRLRECVAVSQDHPYRVGIETAWRQRAAGPAGFACLSVAALRSVGIAARMADADRVEFWTGNDWQVLQLADFHSVGQDDPLTKPTASN